MNEIYGKSELESPKFSTVDMQFVLNENRSLKLELESKDAQLRLAVESLENIRRGKIAEDNNNYILMAARLVYIAKEALAKLNEK